MPKQFLPNLRKVTVYSTALMILTSIHHAYGAFVYHTPWRLHVLLLSIPVILGTVMLYYALVSRGYKLWQLWIFGTITLIASILLIGIFEGLYNHVLKNILFIAGVPQQIMISLYPPGTYEMPDNIIFEVTGILQGIIVIPLIIHFVTFCKLLLSSTQKNTQ